MEETPENARFQLIIPSDVLGEVKLLALRERRSISNMIVVLLAEALRARAKKAEKAEAEGNSRPALLAA